LANDKDKPPMTKLPARTATALFAALLLGVVTAAVIAAEQEKVALPAWLAEKTASLPAAKRDFLLSDAAQGMAARPELLWKRLDGITATQIEAYIDGMMAVIESKKYKPGIDLAFIPLDTNDEDFNEWKTLRPQAWNPAREPGPINVSRYITGRNNGIKTFAGAPLAFTPEDLIAGKVDVAIVGAPLDMGSGFRGAKDGPAYMRMTGGGGGNDMYTMVNPSAELNIVDYGDIAVDNMSTERTMGHVREMVAQIARTGAIPFIVGGDHSLEYSDIAGLADVHGKGSFGVVHFDSHYDAGKGGEHFITHGAPVYRAVKEGHVLGKNYIQVGLRGGWPGPEGFEWMRANGVRYHAMPEVEKSGWPAVMERALKEAREGGKKLYISLDVDVLDPAFIGGTGTPVPGGLTMREALPIVRRLCAENEIIGFEIVEVAPRLDNSYRTPLNANYIMHACLTGVAMYKKGIKQIGYLAEETTEHGADDPMVKKALKPEKPVADITRAPPEPKERR
jgi:agmatinase